MKKIILFYILLTSIISGYAQFRYAGYSVFSIDSKMKTERLRAAKVKKASHYSHGYKFGKINQVGNLCYEYYYDLKGLETKAISYDDGKVDEISTFKYDSAGNQTEEFIYSSDGYLKSKVLLSYGQKHELLCRKDFDYKGNLSQMDYLYDSTELKYTILMSNSKSVFIHQLDSNGFVLYKKTIDNTGFTTDTRSFTNNKDGNRIEMFEIITSPGFQVERATFNYDQSGNLIEETSWNTNLNEPEISYKIKYEYYAK